jgi:hypothetical protein
LLFFFRAAMSDTTVLDDPQQEELSYTDRQVYDKHQQFIDLVYPRSRSFPPDPRFARALSLPLVAAAIALKSAKADYVAYEQASDLLEDPYKRESIVDEVRKAWENGNLESLLASGMW